MDETRRTLGAWNASPRSGRWLVSVLGLGLGLSAMAAACGDDGENPASSGAGGGGAGIPGFEIQPANGGIRRLTSTQLRYSVEYLLGTEAAVLFDVWDDPTLHDFESIAAAELALGATEVSTLETVATVVADTTLADPTHLAQFAPCVMQAPQASCYDEVATKFARVAWRRPVEAEEKARLVKIATDAQARGSGDFDTGLRYELMAILQSPSFLYIVEVGEEQSDGTRKLTGPELASRMAFFLQHRTPDVELLDAADAGALGTADGIREQARRLLGTPEARRSIDRFFSELFFIRDLSNISKDATAYPAWNASLSRSMQEEMLRFLQDIVWTRDADAHELFTSQTTFVDANLAAFYGVPAPAGGFGPVVLPESQGRVGLLGKAGFLARFAHPVLTSPTRRGAFFWERLLCEEIPPPPPGVITNLPPDEPGQPRTMRQKLEAHFEQGSNCAGCHTKIDSVGLAFEHFDAMGQYRETDQGLPIDTKGSYMGLGDFDGVADLGAILAESDEALACIVRNFFRQSMGHLETEGEADALELLNQQFESGGYSVQSLLVEMCANPAFTLVGEPK